MRKLGLTSLLLVAGCATTMADVRQGPAAIAYETSRPPQAVVQCLTEALARTPNPHTVTAYSTGWSIVWVPSAWFLDVLPNEGGGSRVNYYQRTFGGVGAAIPAGINSCR